MSRRSSVTFRGATLDLHGLGIDEGIEEGSGAPSSHNRAMTTGPSGEAHVGMMQSECCHLNRLSRAHMSQIQTSHLARSSPQGRRYSRGQSGTGSRPGSAIGLGGSDLQRASRRQFLQSTPEVRSEADLQSLDEALLFGAEACRHMTKGARLALARLATFASFDTGEAVCFPGQEMSMVFFVLHGQV